MYMWCLFCYSFGLISISKKGSFLLKILNIMNRFCLFGHYGLKFAIKLEQCNYNVVSDNMWATNGSI
jgi:hypothetical protein